MKKIIFVLTAVLMLSMVTPVFAEDTIQTPVIIGETTEQSEEKPILKDVQTTFNAGQRVIIKIYTAPPNYDFTLLDESKFEKDGYHYRMGDVLQISENYDKQTKLASHVSTVSHDEKTTAGQFIPLIDYSSDGYTGQLKLDTASINTQSAGTKSYSYAVTDTREFTGLERNDTYYIPKTAEKNGVTLALKDVQWLNMGGAGYKATAKYSGTGTGSKVTGYISTATYIGEVTKSTLKNVTYKVIYDGYTLPPLPPSTLPWILGGACAVVLIIAGVLLVIYRKSVKIYALRNGSYQVVKRQRISYVDPVINLTVTELCLQSAEYIIVIDRLAVAKLNNQFVRIICEDGSVLHRSINNDGHSCKLHISVNIHESEAEDI